MGSEIQFDKGAQWLVAVAISLGLHVLILIAFALTGGDSPSPLQKVADVAEVSPSQVCRAEADAETPKPPASPVAEERPAPAVQPVEPERPAPEPKPAPAPEPADETYEVKRGDTLSSIAKECDSTLSELLKLNGSTLRKMSNLRVGQRIKVPRKR